MIREVWYEAIDPYYTDEVQTFIGGSRDSLDYQELEHDRWLGREHPAGILFIYRKYTIYESDCEDYEEEMNEANLRRYLQKSRARKGEKK